MLDVCNERVLQVALTGQLNTADFLSLRYLENPMNIIAVCIPAGNFCAPLNQTFRQLGIRAEAHSSCPERGAKHSAFIEHLASPIEPAIKSAVWIVMTDPLQDTSEFLEMTFMNEKFVRAVMANGGSSDVVPAMECMLASCAARTLTRIGLHKKALAKVAMATACSSSNQHVAEEVLGIPSLQELLVGYVDESVAMPDGKFASSTSKHTTH